MTEQQKQKNYQLYIKKLESIGVDTKLLDSTYGDKLLNGTYCISTEQGPAYSGSLIEVVLRKLTPTAVHINDILPEKLKVDQSTLVKVCLLHSIGKAINMIPNDNQWEIEKRGMVYKFNPDTPSIRTGLLSLVLAQNVGISFTPEEAEAMTILDRDSTDTQARFFSSVLATIVRQANEITYLESKINK